MALHKNKAVSANFGEKQPDVNLIEQPAGIQDPPGYLMAALLIMPSRDPDPMKSSDVGCTS